MKKIFIIILTLIAAFAAIPPIVIMNSNRTRTPDISSTSYTSPVETEALHISTKDEIIYAVSDAMQYIDADTPYDVRRAVLDICRNNLNFYTDNQTELPQVSITNYSDELYEKLVKEYEKQRFSFSYNNKNVYIPISKSGNLKTATTDEYTYLESVASPWEAYREDFKKTEEPKCGVSVYGLIFLEEKIGIKDSLCYYLPGVEVNEK